jgi:tyrosyl-tRNA synthetase
MSISELKITDSDLLKNIDWIHGDIKILSKNKKDINILWGVQPRDLPNIEFFIPILQIVEFLKENYTITVLLADIHEMLDSPTLDLGVIQKRCEAYIQLIIAMVELFDVNSYNLKFKYGSTFQTSHPYVIDTYKISSLTTIQRTYFAREINQDIEEKKNVITTDKTMTTLLYPILQALDEKYTNCDIFYGSITQKNMCLYSEELMNKFNHKENKVLYLLQDITKKFNIKFFDAFEEIEKKLEKYTISDILYINKNIIFPIIKNIKDKLLFDNIIIEDYQDMVNKIKNNELTNKQLINITTHYLSKYINNLYDVLLTSQFRYFYECGWLERKFFH